MRKTYKYRLYLNKQQIEKFKQTLTTCRMLYNNALDERKIYYQKNHKGLTAFTQINSLPDKKSENSYLNQVHSQVLQDVFRRLDKAYALFFVRVKAKNNKAGYPRFKSANRYHSFTYPQYGGFKLTDDGLKLSKIGIIKIKLHRPLEGKPKTCTIKREIDRWYACISCEVEPQLKSVPQEAIGIDMGIEHFAFLSNGESIANPKYLKVSEHKLAKSQRKLSKREKGSANRKKQAIRVAKIHRKIKDQRNDFLHKLSRNIVDRFNFIAIEDLTIQSMLKNRYLAKSIADASWGQLINYLGYKEAEAGSEVVRVNPEDTSQFCSECGSFVKKSLHIRVHKCSECGLILPRDYNSAKVILQRALGQGLPEFTPLETAVGQSLN